MEKMSLLKLMYAQIMANDNNGIYPHNLYERRGPKFNPNYTVKDKDSMRQEREFNINGIKVMAYSRKDALQRLKHKNKRKGKLRIMYWINHFMNLVEKSS